MIYGIESTSEEALYGTEKVIIARTRLGDKTYRFTIPAGIKNGATVKLGGGDHFSNDLYIQINVKETF